MRPQPDLVWLGRPAVWDYGEAWQLDKIGVWQRVHSTEVMMEAAIVGEAEIARRFGRLQPLPREAFG